MALPGLAETNAACGAWWAADGTNYTTKFDVDAIEEECQKCFIFRMHSLSDCSMGEISYLSQAGAFDAMVFLACIAFIMAVINACRHRRSPQLVQRHSILQHLYPRCNRSKDSLRGWAFYGLVFMMMVHFLRSKLIFTFSNTTSARRYNIGFTPFGNVFTLGTVILLQGAWFYQHSDRHRKPGTAPNPRSALYAGPSRPPVLLRTLSAMGLVLKEPPSSPRFHIPLYKRRCRIMSHLIVATLVGAMVLYPLIGVVLTARITIDDVAGTKQMVPRTETDVRVFKVFFVWFWWAAMVVCSDFLLAVLIYRNWGMGTLFAGSPAKASKAGVPASAPAAVTAPTADAEAAPVPVAAPVDAPKTTASPKTAGAVPTTEALDPLARFNASKHIKRLAIGRYDSESSSELTLLVAFASVFPIATGIISLRVLIGKYCPYTEAEDDSRGDPYEEPWFDMWNVMQTLALILVYTVDAFPRRKSISIMNFTDNAQDCKVQALWISRILSVIIVVMFTIYERWLVKRNVELIDEVLFMIGYMISIAMTTNIRACTVIAMPWVSKARRGLLRNIWLFLTSIMVSIFYLGLVFYWLLAMGNPNKFGSFKQTRRVVSINFGVVLWPAVMALLTAGVVAIRRPPVRKAKVTAVESIRDLAGSAAVVPSSTSVQPAEPSEKGGDVGTGVRGWSLLDDLVGILAVTLFSWLVWTVLLSSLAIMIVYGLVWYLTSLVLSHVLAADTVTFFDDAESVAAFGGGAESSGDPSPRVAPDPEAPILPGDKASGAAAPPRLGSRMAPLSVDTGEPRGLPRRYNGMAVSTRVRQATTKVVCCCCHKTAPQRAKRSWKQRLRTGCIIKCTQVLMWFGLLLLSHIWYLNQNALDPYKSQPLIIGHRGVWIEGVPELSFQAADLAKSYGFHGVEFDVRLSKDNQLVLMHDETLERTTNGTGNVWDYTLDELRQLQLLSSTNETVYTLEEYLIYLKNLDLIAEIELKQGNHGIMVSKTLDDVCKTSYQNESFVASAEAHFQNLLMIENPAMSLEKDFLYHTSPSALVVPQNANIIGISAEFLLFNPWVIANSHRAKQYIMVYFLVMESTFMINLYRNMGVDMFMINDGETCTEAGLCPYKEKVPVPRYMCADGEGGICYNGYLHTSGNGDSSSRR